MQISSSKCLVQNQTSPSDAFGRKYASSFLVGGSRPYLLFLGEGDGLWPKTLLGLSYTHIPRNSFRIPNARETEEPRNGNLSSPYLRWL